MKYLAVFDSFDARLRKVCMKSQSNSEAHNSTADDRKIASQRLLIFLLLTANFVAPFSASILVGL